nr:hypothetical protein [Tanacetum cinerariifolium]
MLEHRKEDMFDEYERFRANGNESIQAYFICDVDPLAYLAKSPTSPQPSPKPTTQAAQTHEEALMATMQQL